MAPAASRAQAGEITRINFTTEDYRPYNFKEDGVNKGAGYDQVVRMMEAVPIPYTLEMMPWARALALAESEPMTCVFTTAHIDERSKRFKWVEPLVLDRDILISRVGSGIRVRTIDEARNYRVGTQRNDFTQAVLERYGFTNIDLAADMDLTLKKLESGRIDLMPISERFYRALKEDGRPLEEQFFLVEQRFGIACNLTMPDELIKTLQDSLDHLIASGTQAEILTRYGMAPPK